MIISTDWSGSFCRDAAPVVYGEEDPVTLRVRINFSESIFLGLGSFGCGPGIFVRKTCGMKERRGPHPESGIFCKAPGK